MRNLLWPESTNRLRWRMLHFSLLRCTFLSYAGGFLSYAGGFLSYAGRFLFYTADFSSTLQISLLHCRCLFYTADFSSTLQISLLHCRFLFYTADFSSTLTRRFLSYAGGFLFYTADVSPTLADFSPTLHAKLFSNSVLYGFGIWD